MGAEVDTAYTRSMEAVGRGLPLNEQVAADEASEALRDAAEIAERAAADEAAARLARDAYHEAGLPAEEPDDPVASLLEPGELLHASRTTALLEVQSADEDPTVVQGGTLYLTSRRLLLLDDAGALAAELPLVHVEETNLAVERLVLLRLADGSGVAVEAGQPRLLRVQIAAAIAAQRASR